MSLRSQIETGSTPLIGFMGPLVTPKFVEVVAAGGFLHGLWFDQEHAAVPHAELDVLCTTCRAVGLSALVRCPVTDYASVMRPLESGAEGLIIPQVRTMEQVHNAVSWTRYPPQGTRGLFQGNTEAGFGTVPLQEHLDRANRERLLIIQIETPESVELAGEIAKTEGVDGLFVGPGDLACTLGVPGDVMNPRCIEAVEKVSQAVEAAGKWWSGLVRNQEHAALYQRLGCRMFSVAGDYGLVADGLKAARDRFPGLVRGSDDT